MTTAPAIKPPLIEFAGINHTYGHGDARVTAIDNVSLKINSGEFVAIMGPSGSGKSTTMNILGCLDTPTSGHYLFEGVDVGQLDHNQRALLHRTRTGRKPTGHPRRRAYRKLRHSTIHRNHAGFARAQPCGRHHHHHGHP